MPFAAYWALITSAATSLYSIIAFISLTWRLCPHQISPFWLCPLFLYQVSTLNGELSSSNLTSFSWLLPSTFRAVPCLHSSKLLWDSPEPRQTRHSGSGFIQGILTWLEENWSTHQHLIVRAEKISHIHCTNPHMPILLIFNNFFADFSGERYPTVAWVPPLLLLSFLFLLFLLPPSHPTAVRSWSSDMPLSNSPNFPHPSLSDLFLCRFCSFPSYKPDHNVEGAAHWHSTHTFALLPLSLHSALFVYPWFC